jgi:mycothiol synthase
MAVALRAPSAVELATLAAQLDLTGTVAMAYTPPDPARDLRVAEVDGRLAGCAVVQLVGSETVLASDGTEAFCRGHVLPEHRGRGVGSALLGWTLARAAAHPGVVDAWTIAHDADAVPLLEAAGFRLARTGCVMALDDPAAVPAPEWPAGMRLDVSLRGKALVDALVAAVDRAYAHLPRYRGATRAQVARLFAHPDADPTLCLLAFQDGEPVGFGFCLLERHHGAVEGWVHDLGVAPQQRGLGLGRALLGHGIHALRDRGAARVLLGVDAANDHARRLYRRAGFQTTETFGYHRRPLTDRRGA